MGMVNTMRNALTLLLVSLVLFTSRTVSAQDTGFLGADVIQLARTITTECKRTGQLPSAYSLQMVNGGVMAISAANAFELLFRGIVNWNRDGFPQTVDLLIPDLLGPSPNPRFEPSPGAQPKAMVVSEFGYAAKQLLMYAQDKRKLLSSMKLSQYNDYATAQLVLAAATLITAATTEEQIKKGTMPESIVVPPVRSPQSWNNIQNPVIVPAAKRRIIPRLLVTLNGINVEDSGGVGLIGKGSLGPFCGTLRLYITGQGPIAKVRILLDSAELKIFEGIGPHQMEISSPLLQDGAHTASVTAIDDEGSPHAYVFSFMVKNGRNSGFTPIERMIEDIEVDAIPASTPNK